MDRLALNTLLPVRRCRVLNRRWVDSLFLLFLLLAALLLLLAGRAGVGGPLKQWFAAIPMSSPADAVLLLISVVAAMLIHEGGHLLAASLLGFHVFGIVVGPLHFNRDCGHWKLTVNGKTLFQGSVSAMPGSDEWRYAMMSVIAAGPFATLIGGLLIASSSPASQSDSVFQSAFVQVSMLLFILGLIPNSREARQQNDARLFIDLVCRNKGFDEMALKVSLKQQMMRGIRPQDYPEQLIVQMAGFEGRIESELLFAQAMTSWALDSDFIPLADAWDEHALGLAAKCLTRQQNAALAASACFDVMFRHDFEAAREKFEKIDCDSLFPASFEQRVRAARQIASGRLHRAPEHIIRAQYSLPPGNTHYAYERQLLEKLHMYVLLEQKNAMQMKVRAATAK